MSNDGEHTMKTSEHSQPAHGSPEDRGSADRYYGRPCKPHYYPNGTYNGYPITEEDMTPEQVEDYCTAYDEETDRKDWG